MQCCSRKNRAYDRTGRRTPAGMRCDDVSNRMKQATRKLLTGSLSQLDHSRQSMRAVPYMSNRLRRIHPRYVYGSQSKRYVDCMDQSQLAMIAGPDIWDVHFFRPLVLRLNIESVSKSHHCEKNRQSASPSTWHMTYQSSEWPCSYALRDIARQAIFCLRSQC